MKQNKFYQIKNIAGHEYILVGCDGSVITRPIHNIDKSASVFTIQDAKDGDVLVHNSCVFIFMGLKDGIVQAINEFFPKPTNFGDPDIDDDYHPATKEQRDLLKKAMTDAGYIFDFEKKELKEIAN